jgi:hypothetical protein
VHAYVAESLVFLAPGTKKEAPAWVASGVLIKADDGATVVLTAAHNLDDPKLAFRMGGMVNRDPIEDVAFEFRVHPGQDIGLILLRPHAADAFARYAVPVEQIANDDVVTDEDALLVAGFPSALVKSIVEHRKKRVEFGLNSVTYLTGLQNPPKDEQGRFRVSWTEMSSNGGASVKMPAPNGISGGPLWRFRKVASGKLWHPLASGQIIGVATAWNKTDTEFAPAASSWRHWLVEQLGQVK